MRIHLVQFWLLFPIILAFTLGCKKELPTQPTEYSDELQMIRSYHLAEVISDELNLITDQAYYTHKVIRSANATGFLPIVKYHAADSTIIIDYGARTLGTDGKTRSGILKIVFADGYKQSGQRYHVYFDQYTIDGVRVSGSRSVKYLGITWHLESWHIDTDLSLTYPDGSISTWQSSKDRTWTIGYDTPINFDDDQFLLFGKAKGVVNQSLSYSAKIDSALTIYTRCTSIDSGVVHFKTPTLQASIDYSAGSPNICDPQAQIKINNNSYYIYLK